MKNKNANHKHDYNLKEIFLDKKIHVRNSKGDYYLYYSIFECRICNKIKKGYFLKLFMSK
ncbi:hypothetical protein [Clostridium senegalense]|uniref:hypothetical protein n=1 Tax=Clostridium senegalense TaxID=1465809 RepID=UPI000316F387|nr:hypothetical protein [Clostridium senegalense]